MLVSWYFFSASHLCTTPQVQNLMSVDWAAPVLSSENQPSVGDSHPSIPPLDSRLVGWNQHCSNIKHVSSNTRPHFNSPVTKMDQGCNDQGPGALHAPKAARTSGWAKRTCGVFWGTNSGNIDQDNMWIDISRYTSQVYQFKDWICCQATIWRIVSACTGIKTDQACGWKVSKQTGIIHRQNLRRTHTNRTNLWIWRTTSWALWDGLVCCNIWTRWSIGALILHDFFFGRPGILGEPGRARNTIWSALDLGKVIRYSVDALRYGVWRQKTRSWRQMGQGSRCMGKCNPFPSSKQRQSRFWLSGSVHLRPRRGCSSGWSTGWGCRMTQGR